MTGRGPSEITIPELAQEASCTSLFDILLVIFLIIIVS